MKSELVVAGSRERETRALMVVDLGMRGKVQVCVAERGWRRLVLEVWIFEGRRKEEEREGGRLLV